MKIYIIIVGCPFIFNFGLKSLWYNVDVAQKRALEVHIHVFLHFWSKFVYQKDWPKMSGRNFGIRLVLFINSLHPSSLGKTKNTRQWKFPMIGLKYVTSIYRRLLGFWFRSTTWTAPNSKNLTDKKCTLKFYLLLE